MDSLKNYVCTVPFTNMEIHDRDNFMCCPSWLLKRLPSEVPISELWNSDEAIEIRKSVIDGSYRHCDKNQCPYLSQLLKFGNGQLGPLIHVNDIPPYIKKYVDTQEGYMEEGCQIIQMAFDRTCNYKCPSCRKDLFVADSEKVKKVNVTIDEIEKVFSKDLKWLYVTGSGDPFVSVGFRNFLRTFNPEKYPKLTNIHIHTNGSMWNESMWESIKPSHPYIKTCEISIDAGSKETYENITRLGGNWENLLENLKFINSIDKLKYIKPSFVVQSSNYKEMGVFLDLMKTIFGKKGNIFFGKINNWGTFSDDEFKLLNVTDINHPEHENFLKEFDKIWKDPQVFHNMHDIIKVNKKII